ncbi:5-methylcytosine-specific restriction protein A [Balamuthia mandrillaris]
MFHSQQDQPTGSSSATPSTPVGGAGGGGGSAPAPSSQPSAAAMGAPPAQPQAAPPPAQLHASSASTTTSATTTSSAPVVVPSYPAFTASPSLHSVAASTSSPTAPLPTFSENRSSSASSSSPLAAQKVSPSFVPGMVYLRKSLHDDYGGQRQGGISTPALHDFILLFTKDAASRKKASSSGFRDQWANGLFYYRGEKMRTNEPGLKAGNRSLLCHKQERKKVHLFSTLAQPGQVKYMGEVEYLSHYLLNEGSSSSSPFPTVVFVLKPVGWVMPSSPPSVPPIVSSSAFSPPLSSSSSAEATNNSLDKRKAEALPTTSASPLPAPTSSEGELPSSNKRAKPEPSSLSDFTFVYNQQKSSNLSPTSPFGSFSIHASPSSATTTRFHISSSSTPTTTISSSPPPHLLQQQQQQLQQQQQQQQLQQQLLQQRAATLERWLAEVVEADPRPRLVDQCIDNISQVLLRRA